MGIGVQSKSILTEDLGSASTFVQDLISKDDIVIFSKTYCPYCKMAKEVSDSRSMLKFVNIDIASIFLWFMVKQKKAVLVHNKVVIIIVIQWFKYVFYNERYFNF